MKCRYCGLAIWWSAIWYGWRDRYGNICPRDGYWHRPLRG